MTKKQPDASDAGWLEKFMAGTSPVDRAVPAFRPQTSPSERKADERTQAVRAMTDAATEKRQATTARLKAARLEKEATRCAAASAALLRASLAAARGRPEDALGPLEAAAQGFDAAEMALHAACARRRKGQLLGGDEGQALIAAADEALRSQGIRAPARWAALYVPGFSEG